MLESKYMWLKSETSGVNEEGSNMQSINEYILRQAVHSCDSFSTDILIFYEYQMKEFYIKKVNEIDIYFRKNGINWANDTGYIVMGKIPEKYRWTMKLIRDNEDNVKLYELPGNA